MKAKFKEDITYLYNKYSYAEIDILSNEIDKIQTKEWRRRLDLLETLSDEELKEINSKDDIMQMYAEDMREDPENDSEDTL